MGDFQAIVLTGNMNVEFIPAAENAIESQLWDTDAEKFRWAVNKNGVLSITLRPTAGNVGRADVKVFYKAMLYHITVNEARLTTTIPIESHVLEVEIADGSSSNLLLNTKDLELSIKGNSAVLLHGEAKYLTVQASERSKVDSRELISVSSQVDASMSAEVFVHATERLVAQTKSGATVYHIGAPTILKNYSHRTGFGGGIFSIGEPRGK